LPAPFVVGAGRSGTTLLRLMLDAHSEMVIPPETHFLPEAIERCLHVQESQARNCFLDTVQSSTRWVDFHLDPDVLRQRIEGLGEFDLGEALRAFYAVYAERFGKRRWGDKTPGYVMHMQDIKPVLPEAHFVHLIRDGRDAALSIQEMWFGPNSVHRAAKWWMDRIANARAQARSIHSYLEIRYEDLVETPESALRRVCEFIALPWDAALLNYHVGAPERIAELGDMSGGSGRLVTADERRRIHEFATRPPETGRIGRWRREMSEADRKVFERIAGPTLQELGYEIE
jgi:Sulfotransferase family